MDLSTREGRRQQGERIKRATKEAGLSLDELSSKIGCSRALIYQYVSGASLAQSDRLQEIGAVVGRSLTWFFATDDSDDAVDGSAIGSNSRTAERDEGWIAQQSANLSTLVDAYASPVDWRKVADTCEQLVPLLRHSSDKQALADILLKQGNALVHCNDLGNARVKLEQAGELLRAAGNAERALDCSQSLGHVGIMLGRTEEALKQFEQVSAGDEWSHRWSGALSMGAAHEVLGNYSLAADLFLRALEIVDSDGGQKAAEVARLYIEANWANLELDWGDYRDGVERAAKCVEMAQRLGVEDQYVEALLTRGMAYLGLLELKRAEADLRSAYNVAEVTRDHQRSSLALACLSQCLSTSLQRVDAISAGKEALAGALRCGASRAELMAQRSLAEAYLAVGNGEEARYHIDRGAAIASNLRLREPTAYFNVLCARAHYVAADYEATQAAAFAALDIAEQLDSKHIRCGAHLIISRAAIARRDWVEAINHSSTAATVMSKMGVTVGAWQCQGIVAAALAGQGDAAGADDAWTETLKSFTIHRQAILDASGADAIFEMDEAFSCWRHRIHFLVDSGRIDEATSEVMDAEWPPLRLWLDSVINPTEDGTGHA